MTRAAATAVKRRRPVAALKPCRVFTLAAGGSAKTTTCATLGHALAARGRRVLLVDLDPAHHLTSYVGDVQAPIVVAHVLRRPDLIESALTGSSAGTAQILNGSFDTARVADEIRRASRSPSTHIARLLARIANRYEYVLVDCASEYDVMAKNAEFAATDLLVPLAATDAALSLRRTVESLLALASVDGPLVAAPQLRALLTKCDPKATVSELRAIAAQLPLPSFNAVIHYSHHAIGSFPTQMTVLDFAPKSTIAADYRALALEIDS